MIEPSTDIAQRLGRVQEALRREKIGSLLIYNSAQHTMLRMDQIFYLTDFRALGPSILLVPSSGRPALTVSPVWDGFRAREASQGVDVSTVQPGGLASRAVELARDLPRPLALAGRDVMPLQFADQLFGQLGEDLADADKLIPSLSACRTPLELERIEQAAAIADAGFARLREVAEPGMWEHELAAEVEAVMQTAGAEDNFGLIAAGQHNVAIRPPEHRRLERGDVIVGEITPCYRGYLAQLCRTFILGAPTDLQREKFELLIEAERRGLEAAIPGRPSSEIARAVNNVIGAAGYGEYCRPPYMRTRGHGLGLGGVVPYDVTEDSSPILEERMTMVIHPNQYIPETGYLMLGDTVVIEAAGPRRLTSTPLKLFWKEIL